MGMKYIVAIEEICSGPFVDTEDYVEYEKHEFDTPAEAIYYANSQSMKKYLYLCSQFDHQFINYEVRDGLRCLSQLKEITVIDLNKPNEVSIIKYTVLDEEY